MATQIDFRFGTERAKSGARIPAPEQIAAVDAIKREAATLYSGYSLTFVEGGWWNGAGVLVEERGAVLTIISESGAVDLAQLESLALFIAKRLNQEEVWVNLQAVILRKYRGAA